MITCRFKDVSERDVDLLLLEEFAISSDFLRLFTAKISTVDLTSAVVISVEQSKTDPKLGESDMTIVIEKNGTRYGLLIEDKIDALAMPQQAARYFKRGEKDKKNGEYHDFFVFIVAPQGYLEINQEAQHYPYHVNYEDCLKYFKAKSDPRSLFKSQQLEQAINKQRQGYQAIIDAAATDFWQEYADYQAAHFDDLELINSSKGRPSGSTWITFRANHSKIHIVHKTEKGVIDAEFAGMANKEKELNVLCQNVLGNLFESRIEVCTIGKSAAIRIRVAEINVNKPFEEQKEKADMALREVRRIRKILDDFPKKDLFEILDN